MALQFKFYSIPLVHGGDEETALNAFLKTVHAITVHRELVSQDNRYYWAIAVEYMTGTERGEAGSRQKPKGKTKIDYKEVLTPEDFAVYAKLRDWRKEIAEREAVQLYTVFMNEQLAAMVRNRVTTTSGLRDIEGVGDGRIGKYGDAVLAILKEAFNIVETNDK